jgi:hypothetical protein
VDRLRQAWSDESIMTDQTAIETATKRLTLALDALEAATERRLGADRDEARLADQVHALGADRSKLAAELDAQAARSKRLEATNRDIALRLDAAIDGIRSVLDAQER